MSDNDLPFYARGQKPYVRHPVPGELVWSLVVEGKTVRCELRDHGEVYGWEVQILIDGEFVYGHIVPTREIVEREAAELRQQYAQRQL